MRWLTAITLWKPVKRNKKQQQQKTIIAPIVITDHVTDVQTIFEALKVKCNIKLNSVGRKIFPNSTEDKNKIIEHLKKEKIGFFSHPEKNTKTFKVVLAGLPQVDTACIASSLTEQTLTPTNITMFNTQSKNKLYLVHFNAEEVNKKVLDAVKYVYHHVVKWMPYKPKRNGPTQCLKCLMYGHGISSCCRYTACMLCAGEHLTKQCPTHNDSAATNIVFKSFNCASANLAHAHKANDVNCPFCQKYEDARNNARSKTAPIQRSQTHTSQSTQQQTKQQQQNQTYADRLRASSSAPSTSNQQSRTHTQARQPNTSTQSIPSDNCNASPISNLWSFEECANLLFNSIQRLQNCNSKIDQLMVIADLMKHACK